MEATQQKDPICNGRVNKSLSLREIYEFSLTQKVQILWNMTVEGKYNHSQQIDSSVWVSIPELYTYEQIKAMNDYEINTAISIVWHEMIEHEKKMRGKTIELHKQQGREILEAQTKLGFKGELEMSLGKLDGYLKAIGHWNDCNPDDICPVLWDIDTHCPRVDYGVNNPNTGSKKHTWSTRGDYVFLTVDYISETEAEKWVEFFNKFILPKQQQMKADSLRYILDEYPKTYDKTPHYEFKVLMWWD